MPANYQGILAKEQDRGRVLYAQEAIRQSWELDMTPKGAVCVFEAESREQLQGMIDSFPNIQLGYADYQVWPMKPDSAYYNLPQKA